LIAVMFLQTLCFWGRLRAARLRAHCVNSGKARLTTAANDGITRSMNGFQVIDYDTPQAPAPPIIPNATR